MRINNEAESAREIQMLTRKFAFEKGSGILVGEMIDVLMSTYNGSRYLREQIESILGQTFPDFRLMIRDDGSVDDTREILESYARKDERVTIAEDDLGNLGASRSFMRLIEISDAPFFMLSDQDDVWLPEKIALSKAKIDEMGARFGDMPLLAFTDLKIVSETLDEIDGSMWHYQRLNPNISSDWGDLLAQNVVTGCTIIANRAVAQASLPFALPEMMHDHWLAVNAAKYGRVEYVPEPTVLYRQHGKNIAGGIEFGSGYAAAKTAKIGGKMAFYRRAAAYFGGVTAGGLMKRKVRLNLRRLVP
jgi:glycosyltransferase involved in cell wall biosynthesis